MNTSLNYESNYLTSYNYKLTHFFIRFTKGCHKLTQKALNTDRKCISCISLTYDFLKRILLKLNINKSIQVKITLD